MITGELKSKIDAVWNDFWSDGISNPLEVMEQLTLLLFIKGLDETHTRAERVYEAPYDTIAPGGPEDLFDENTLDQFFAALDDLTKAAG